MVDRELRLVILSRVVSPTHLDDDQSLESCVTSLILSLAAFYTGRGGIARNLINEAVVLFRSLGLFRKQEHEGLSEFDSEICKRLFWIFYINQKHERLDSVVPHYPFCFDPMETDWEFLIPRENEVESLFYANSPPHPNPSSSYGNGVVVLGSPPISSAQPAASALSRPIVSGFHDLLRVYLCILDIFSADFPRPPPSVLISLPLSMEPRFLVSQLSYGPTSEINSNPSVCLTTGMTLKSVTQLMRRVRTTVEQIPPEIQIRVNKDEENGQNHRTLQTMSRSTMQKFIIAANIHMTSLFVQSTCLETYAAQIDRQSVRQRQPQSSNRDTGRAPPSIELPAMSLPPAATGMDVDVLADQDGPVEAQIWRLREKLASEALDIIRTFPQEALEANGASLILKARKIAATLLERDDSFPLSADAAARMDKYLEQFIHALASIDNLHLNTYHVAADTR